MGWFSDKYGEDAHPDLPIDDYIYIEDNFGEQAAIDTLCDVQDGKISVETLEKYLFRSKK